MDFLSIRKKAKARAEAQARGQSEEAGKPAAPQPGAATVAAPALPALPPPAEPAAAATLVPPRSEEPAVAAPPALPADPWPEVPTLDLDPPAATPPPAPIEDALRAELARLETLRPPARTEESAPDLPPPGAAPDPRTAERPFDPLAEFFWNADEVVPALPDLGLAAGAAGGLAREEERIEYVVFSLGREEYAVPITEVREVLKPPEITEVPRAPAHVIGMITLRGEVVAVVDPRLRLGLPRAPAGARARVVVCQGPDGPIGLLVDGVSEVARIPPAAIELQPQLGAGAVEAVAGIGRLEDRLYILLDLAELLRGPGARPGAAP